VETVNWQFKTEMGEEMTEDNIVGMEQLPLDYFMACFPPQAMRNIIALTNKSYVTMIYRKWKWGSCSSSLGF
jgi:hypothetical protein